MTWYISDRLTGGQSQFWKDTYSSYSRAFTERDKLRKWHTHISTWMEQNGINGYWAVNSKKTIFMKCKGDEYIIHGLFVDDMMHIYSCNAMNLV